MALADRGHRVTFLERDVPWYAKQRCAYCNIHLYSALKEGPPRFGRMIAEADLAILGSYTPDGAVLANWITTQARGITAFYDIDTLMMLAMPQAGRDEYISPAIIPRFGPYLSFTGGPPLDLIEQNYGSRRTEPFYCIADPNLPRPLYVEADTGLGYLGTFSADRQPKLERLLLEPARALPEKRFAVAGDSLPPQGCPASPDGRLSRSQLETYIAEARNARRTNHNVEVVA